MHLLMAGTRLKGGRGRQQCDGEESEHVSVSTEDVGCVMCLWGALRIVRVTEGALLARLHDIARGGASNAGG